MRGRCTCKTHVLCIPLHSEAKIKTNSHISERRIIAHIKVLKLAKCSIKLRISSHNNLTWHQMPDFGTWHFLTLWSLTLLKFEHCSILSLIHAAHIGIEPEVKEKSHSSALLFLSLCVSLPGMTPYEPAEWHSDPDPRQPLPPSLFHHPLFHWPSLHTLRPTAPPPFQSEPEREKGDRECTLLLTAPLPPSFSLSLSRSHTPPPVSPSPPSFSFGEAAIRPCPSLLANRQTRKQSEHRDRKA